MRKENVVNALGQGIHVKVRAVVVYVGGVVLVEEVIRYDVVVGFGELAVGSQSPKGAASPYSEAITVAVRVGQVDILRVAKQLVVYVA